MLVQSLGGRILRADEPLGQLLGRERIEGKGFDIVDPPVAAEGARMMTDNFGKAVRVWFPFVDPAGTPIWCRFECRWPPGLMVNAIWLEDNPALHRLHAERL